MITLKSQREIEAMDRAGDFLASIHIGLRDLIKPGLDLWEVEEYVRRRCKEANVLPLQIGVEGSLMDYPYATCCGLNDEVAHAFPRHVILKDGDLLKVDMVLSEPLDKSVLDVSKLDFDNVAQVKKYTESYSGGLADSCWAYAVGNVSQEVQDLMDVTKECLYKGIEKAVVGNRLGDIGAAIQEYAESKGYGVVRDLIKPGLDLWEVEEYVRRRCKEVNVLPLQIGVEGSLMDYPYATCCGLNDEVAHAFPRHVILKDGDLLKVDMVLSEPLDKSVLDVSKLDFDNVAQVKKYTESYTGGLADSCWAYAVGNVSQEVKDLMDVTKECLYKGIEKAVVGNRLGDIGAAIQEYAESKGYGVVRDLVGHGVGPTMHEEPMVPHYGRAGRGLRLREGMVLTIEPMINTGTWEIDTDMETGWAHKTLDGGLSCQYEHQFVITKDGPVILTSQGEEGTY